MIGNGPLLFLGGFIGCAATLICVAFADAPVAAQVFDALRTTATVTIAGVGVWVAFHGLQTWRRQLHGTAGFDACRKLLTAAYELRDVIPKLRSPLKTISRKEDEDFDTAARRASVDEFNEALKKLLACEAEKTSVEVLFGSEAVQPFKELRSIVGDIRWAMQLHGERESQAHRHFGKQMMGILYEVDEPLSLAFTDRLAGVIHRIEATLAPVVRQGHR